MKIRYHNCGKCGARAVWYYMPGGSGINYYCDDCVPRGCACNVHNIDMYSSEEELELELERNRQCGIKILWWTKEDYENHRDKRDELFTKNRMWDSFYYEVVDENDLRFPCCEFDYDPDGQENYSALNRVVINRDVLRSTFKKLSTNIDTMLYWNIGGPLLDEENDSTLNKDMDYNSFMAVVSIICREDGSEVALKFLNTLKEWCIEHRKVINPLDKQLTELI